MDFHLLTRFLEHFFRTSSTQIFRSELFFNSHLQSANENIKIHKTFRTKKCKHLITLITQLNKTIFWALIP
jgi:hypothetical protein